jgi:hypothetical protein
VEKTMSEEQTIVADQEPVITDEQKEIPEIKKEPTEEEQKKEYQNKVQKRIDKLTRDKYELRGKIEAMEKMMNASTQQQQPQTSDRPVKSNFQTDEDYIDALTEWKIEKKLGSFEEKITQKQEQTITENSWGQKVEEAKKVYPDWEYALEESDGVMIPKIAELAIMSSSVGPDIVYHLAKNQEDSAKLSALKDMSAALFIGQIEAKIMADKAKPKEDKKVSQAPPPPPEMGGLAKPNTDPDKMSTSEWLRWRNEQLKKKRN